METQINIPSSPITAVFHLKKTFSLLDRLECFPKSKVCFEEILDKTLDWLKYFGNRPISFADIRTGSIEIMPTLQQLYMSYNKPLNLFSRKWDELVLLRCEEDVKTEYQFKRIAVRGFDKLQPAYFSLIRNENLEFVQEYL
jgi:hypothetical protein